MGVILDITKLLNEGKITQTEFERYQQLSTEGTETFLSNILVGIGVIGICWDIFMMSMYMGKTVRFLASFFCF